MEDTVTTTPQDVTLPLPVVEADSTAHATTKAAREEGGSRERMHAPGGKKTEPAGHGRSTRALSAEVEKHRTAEASEIRSPSTIASDPRRSDGSEVAAGAKALLTEIRSRGSTSSAFAVPRRKPLHDL